MKTATLTETKNNLSALIDRVRSGEPLLVLDRGRPVARIEPALAVGGSADDRLDHLERQGIVRRAAGTVEAEVLNQAPPPAKGGASLLKALLTEREHNR